MKAVHWIFALPQQQEACICREVLRHIGHVSSMSVLAHPHEGRSLTYLVDSCVPTRNSMHAVLMQQSPYQPVSLMCAGHSPRRIQALFTCLPAGFATGQCFWYKYGWSQHLHNEILVQYKGDAFIGPLRSIQASPYTAAWGKPLEAYSSLTGFGTIRNKCLGGSKV